MIILETKDHDWFCMNSVSLAKKRFKEENIFNLWEQPFEYPCDFFWGKKDGVVLEKSIPMRKWELDLPLSKCLEGSVKWIANKETTKTPKWYREFLNTNWDEERKKYINKCKKYAGLFQDANGDKNKESNVLIDFFLNETDNIKQIIADRLQSLQRSI